MKLVKQLLVLLVFVPYLAFSNSKDSIPSKETPKYNSINVKMGINTGKEIGPLAKLEYENSKWGKIILHTEIALYKSNTLIWDAGLGYGYPFLNSKSNTLYLNSYITFSQLGVDVAQNVGPSAMFELEYKKTWSKFSLSLATYFRQQLLYDNEEYAYNRNLSHYLLNYTVGVYFGLTYSFPLKKHHGE
jgi:hypothetical protein